MTEIRPIISLTGMPGCGKSLVGEELSRLLSCSWADLDRAVEAAAGKTIPQIFRDGGEPAFRALEATVLESVISTDLKSVISTDLKSVISTERSEWRNLPSSLILSLGGGTILSPGNQALILGHTTCIYLCATPAELLDNIKAQSSVQRPLLGAPTEESLAALLQQRAPAYSKAHLSVETAWRTPLEIAKEIVAKLRLPAPGCL